MAKQTIPDIDFDKFVLPEIPKLFAEGRIFINEQYQRGDIWTHTQRIELIRSIINSYSIGVIVLFVNEQGRYEVLDGQQRLLTIEKYLSDKLDLNETDIPKYSVLKLREQTLLDAYCVFYLKLKSHDPETKEEDIVQTFLRLQEGTPLNKAERINAYRGLFKDAFREARERNPFFRLLGKERRFRWRQLAAEMLLIELEGDFQARTFPNLDTPSLIKAAKTYEKKIPPRKVKFFIGNLDLLHSSLNVILTAFTPREAIAFYLLVSYLRKTKANNTDLLNELCEFAKEFLKNLNSFSIYDDKPPAGMTKSLFALYKKFKEESKVLTTSESLRKRLDIMIDEFDRLYPVIKKDPKRFHDADQKRILYFRQKGKCVQCGKEMKFDLTTAHHIVPHSGGGKTDDLSQAILVDEKCHRRLEKRLTEFKFSLKPG
jgi:hypothetical protein